MPPPAETPVKYRDKALADDSVPQALKDLLTRIIPEQRFDDLRELVREGVINPLLVPEKYPLMSAVAQVMTAKEPKKWLAVLFAENPAAVMEAVVPSTAWWGSDINQYQPDRNIPIELPLLTSKLLGDGNTPVMDILELGKGAAGQILGMKAPLRSGNNELEPLFHHIYNSREFTVEVLDRMEKMTGSADFLSLRNSRGETMFHRIASQPTWAEAEDKLDLASWMLQRKPQLVNEPDRFGWTPLDRLLSRTRGELDSSMGRLLIVSGARLEKQMAAKFNVAAELDERSGKRLDKPLPRRLPGPGAPV